MSIVIQVFQLKKKRSSVIQICQMHFLNSKQYGLSQVNAMNFLLSMQLIIIFAILRYCSTSLRRAILQQNSKLYLRRFYSFYRFYLDIKPISLPKQKRFHILLSVGTKMFLEVLLFSLLFHGGFCLKLETFYLYAIH